MTRPNLERRNLDRHYAVFISYRHADNIEQGRQWAIWLHQALESYEVPPDLIGNVTPEEKVVPDSLYPVFRDEEKLPAGADLTQNIRQALERSENLVVICSPRSVESRFVAEEIRYFKELGKATHILALIIDGEPNATDDAGKARLGITPEMECLPERLRFGAIAPDNQIDWTRRTEPIAADVRPEGRPEQGWTSADKYREALAAAGEFRKHEIAQKVTAYAQRLENAKLKIVAGAMGVPLGVLTERDEAMRLEKARQRARVRHRWLAAVSVLALLAVVGGAFAWRQWKLKLAERRLAMLKASESDLSTGESRLAANDTPGGLAYLASALRNNPSNFTAATRLLSVMRTMPCLISSVPRAGDFTWASFSPDGRWILLPEKDAAQVRDTQTGAAVGAPMKHDGEVSMAVFSADGKRVVTGSLDKTMRVWDAATGKPRTDPIRLSSKVWSLAISPDGKRILPGTEDNTAQMYDVETGRPVGQPLKLDTSAGAVAFSPDGRRVSVAMIGSARVWDVETGEPVGKSLPSATLMPLPAVFSPDSKRLLTTTSNDDGQSIALHVWEVETGREIGHAMKHENPIVSASFSPDGKWVLSACGDRFARLWKVETGSIFNTMNHGGKVGSARFSVDGLLVITAADDRTVRVWEAGMGRPIGATLSLPGQAGSAQFSPDGKWILADSAGRVTVWATPVAAVQPEPMRHAEGLFKAVFSPDGSRVIAVPNLAVQVWDLRTGKPAGPLIPYGDLLSYAVFSPDGAWVLTASRSSSQVMDAITGKPVGQPLPLEAAPYSGGFSPDGQRLVISERKKAAHIWDVATGKTVGEPIVIAGLVETVRFSPDGKWIMTAYLPESPGGTSGGAVELHHEARIWDATTGKATGPVLGSDGSIGNLDFTRDGKRLFTVYGGNLQFWSVPDCKPLGQVTLAEATQLNYGELSPDGTRYLGATDNNARLWDVATGRVIGEMMRHDEHPTSFNFSADGNWIVTSTPHSSARVWSAWTGRSAGGPLKHLKGIPTACFSPDGQWVLTASWDKTAQLWEMGLVGTGAPDWFIELAEALAGERINARKVMEPAHTDLPKFYEKLRALPGNDLLSRFGRWFVADRATRTVSPASNLTVPEYISVRLKENGITPAQQAYFLNPGNPLAVAARAKYQPENGSAMALCRYALEQAKRSSNAELLAHVRAIIKVRFPREAEFQ